MLPEIQRSVVPEDGQGIPHSTYYFMKVWVEPAQDYESMIVHSPAGEPDPISGARTTLAQYLRREYGEGITLKEGVDYIIEEITLVNLPIVLRDQS